MGGGGRPASARRWIVLCGASALLQRLLKKLPLALLELSLLPLPLRLYGSSACRPRIWSPLQLLLLLRLCVVLLLP